MQVLPHYRVHTSNADHCFPSRQISHMLQLTYKLKFNPLASSTNQNKYHGRKNQELTMKVSLKEAKMWATPKTNSPSLVAGPRVTVSSLGSLVLLLDYKSNTIHQHKLSGITFKKNLKKNNLKSIKCLRTIHYQT